MIERLIRNLTNNFARDENIFNQQRKSSFFEKKNSGYWKSLPENYTKSRKAEIKIFY